MMGWSLRCYIPSFVKIGLPLLKKKIFEGFFTIYGRGAHLGYVTQMPRTNLRSPTQGGSTKNLALIGQTVLEKQMFEIVYDDDGRTPDRRRTISIL